MGREVVRVREVGRRVAVLLLLGWGLSTLPAAGLLAAARPSGLAGPAPAAVAPVPGPVVRPFDPPAEPYAPGHRGVDLLAVGGQQVVSALPGTVAFSGLVAGTGWVTVDHGGGLDTTYGPLEPRLVGQGERVPAGAPIGRLPPSAGSLSWGARLAGAYIDPLSLLARWAARLVPVDAPPPARHRSASPALPPVGPAVAVQAGGAVPAGRAVRAWPLRGPVTSGFGLRTHPVTGALRAHAGIDIAAPTGTPVRAAGAGRVHRAGHAGGYGLLVVVGGGDGVSTRYAHLSRITVAVGDPVEVGTMLGAVGSTGVATGPHLHFEVRRGGGAVDPLPWLP